MACTQYLVLSASLAGVTCVSHSVGAGVCARSYPARNARDLGIGMELGAWSGTCQF
jgi:hypothetical protein